MTMPMALPLALVLTLLALLAAASAKPSAVVTSFLSLSSQASSFSGDPSSPAIPSAPSGPCPAAEASADHLPCLQLAVTAAATAEDGVAAAEALAGAAAAMGQPRVAVLALTQAVGLSRARTPSALQALQLGNALGALGKRGKAVAFFALAAKLRPESCVPWNNAALQLQSEGRYRAAQALYKEAMAREPRNMMPLLNLVALLSLPSNPRGSRAAVAKLFAYARRIRPRSFAVAAVNAEVIEARIVEEAAAGGQVTAESQQELLSAVAEAINCLFGTPDGDADMAVSTRSRTDLLDSLVTLAENAVGRLAELRGQQPYAWALDRWRSLVQPAGRHPSGETLAYGAAACVSSSRIGLPDRALAPCTWAAEHLPDSLVVVSTAGLTHYHMEDFKAAVRYYRQAVDISPTNAALRNGLASALLMTWDLNAAVEVYEEGVRHHPEDNGLRNNLMHAKARRCDWRGWDEDQAFARRMAETEPHVINAFHSLAYNLLPAHLKAVAQAVAAKQTKDALRHGTRYLDLYRKNKKQRQPGARLRVAYVSTDFTDHPVGHKVMPVFGLHARDRFEVWCLMIGADADNQSEPAKKIRTECEHWVDMHTKTWEEVATYVAGQGVQILINLNGHTQGAMNELFVLRPAPVQVMYLGFAGTLGFPEIDYLVTDASSAPPEHAREGYVEKLAFLPENLIVSHYREYRSRVLEDRAQHDANRQALGLPAAGTFLFCNFNNMHKLDPNTFAVWMRILTRVPGSHLWLQRTPVEAEAFVRLEAERSGVDPARIVFTDKFPLEHHLSIKSLCDLFLDTPLYNSHTTALEALWAAVPVVTLPLATMTSRISSNEVAALGFRDELVASSFATYESIAVDLATDPAKLKGLRDRLVQARLTAPLFDTPRWVKNFEKLLEAMWSRHASGMAPAHIFLEKATDFEMKIK